MSYRSERFNRSMPRLDAFTAAFDDPSKIAAVSDGGAGVERMTDALDYDPVAEQADEQTRTEAFWQLYAGAVLWLVVTDKLHLLPTLDLIIRNGDDQDATIKAICAMRQLKRESAERYCERQRKALAELFVSAECT